MATKRIVLTGGPGAGKSTIAALLAKDYPKQLICVPEAASQVYTELQTRWDRLDDGGRRKVQKRIYTLQLEQESRYAQENPGKVLILDRGTVDGGAYWPEGAEFYWREMRTTLPMELSRYDAVIWMQTCAMTDAYDQRPNPCRHENPQAAVEFGLRVKRLWQDHPRFYQIEVYPTLQKKFRAVVQVLRKMGIIPR